MQGQCWWSPGDCQSLMRPVSPATLLRDAWRWHISHAETGTFDASFSLSNSLIPCFRSESHNYGGICFLLSNRLQVRDKGQAWSKNYQRGDEKSFQDETCMIQVCLPWQCQRRGLVTQSRFLASHMLLCVCLLSCFSRVWLFATLWTVACQIRLSMGFSRQEYWSGLPCPPPGIFPTSYVSCIGRQVLPISYVSCIGRRANPHLLCLLHWQASSLPLAPPRKPTYCCTIRQLFSEILYFLSERAEELLPEII